MKQDIWGVWPFLAWECIFIADKMNNHNVSHSVSTTEWAIPSWNLTFPWFFHFFHLHLNIIRHHSSYLEGCLYDQQPGRTHTSQQDSGPVGMGYTSKSRKVEHIISFHLRHFVWIGWKKIMVVLTRKTAHYWEPGEQSLLSYLWLS